MNPYGSMWAHIKTGRSHMAQDHFQITPDPKRAMEGPQIYKTVKAFFVEPLEFIKNRATHALGPGPSILAVFQFWNAEPAKMFTIINRTG